MGFAELIIEFLRDLRFFKPAPKKVDAYLVFWIAGRFTLLGGGLALATSVMLAGQHFLGLAVYDVDGNGSIFSILGIGLAFFAMGLTALYYVWPPRRH